MRPYYERGGVYILGEGWSGRRDEGVLKGYLTPASVAQGRLHPKERVEAARGDLAPALLYLAAGRVAALQCGGVERRARTRERVEDRAGGSLGDQVPEERDRLLVDGVRPEERAQGQAALFGESA